VPPPVGYRVVYKGHMIAQTSSWADVPSAPAVYAMYGGEHPRTWVAYVGIAGNLQGRLIQHFVRRDSSVVTGSSAVGVNIELVTHVNWWEDQKFSDDDHRHAAEMVAFDVLDPALRSRGNTRRTARDLAADPSFRDAMSRLFAGQPSGQFVPPRLGQVAVDVRELTERVRRLEQKLERLMNEQGDA
jgi:hypothetical protein